MKPKLPKIYKGIPKIPQVIQASPKRPLLLRNPKFPSYRGYPKNPKHNVAFY